MVTMRPHTSDPYPDRCRRHPGARPNEATDPPPTRTVTTRPAASRSVVEPTTPRPDQVITIDHTQRPPDPFAANTTVPIRPLVRPRPSGLDQHRPTDPATLTVWTMPTDSTAAVEDLDEATGDGDQGRGIEPSNAPAKTGPGLPTIAGTHRHRSSLVRTPVLPCLDWFAMAPRRDERDGRCASTRPVGRGAAEGGGAHRSLGNGETSCIGHQEVTVWR